MQVLSLPGFILPQALFADAALCKGIKERYVLHCSEGAHEAAHSAGHTLVDIKSDFHLRWGNPQRLSRTETGTRSAVNTKILFTPNPIRQVLHYHMMVF